MLGRRRFLKLFSGGLVAAAHLGVPAILIRPIMQAVDLVDGDFVLPLYGLLTNARFTVLDSDGIRWPGEPIRMNRGGQR